MQALKAHVRNGHFVIDEPTDLNIAQAQRLSGIGLNTVGAGPADAPDREIPGRVDVIPVRLGLAWVVIKEHSAIDEAVTDDEIPRAIAGRMLIRAAHLVQLVRPRVEVWTRGEQLVG